MFNREDSALFHKHIDGMTDLSYLERLCAMKLYSIGLYNSLSHHLRNLRNCSVHMFKNRLNKYLSTLLDDPTLAYNDNSVDARISETRWRLQCMA